MKTLLLVCTGLLLLGVANMPIGYYTLLRIAVTIGAVAVVVSEMGKGINTWVILFGLIGIIFNPLIPVYLNSKQAWALIDIICAVIFGVKALSIESKN